MTQDLDTRSIEATTLAEHVTAGLIHELETGRLTRCVAGHTLRHRLVALRDTFPHATTTRPSATAILGHLLRSGIAEPIPVDVVGARGPSEFFLLGPGLPQHVDPLELLRAMVPDGVICYFSAISFHELTTQHTAHHHVAKLVDRPRRDAPPRPRKPQARNENPPQFDPLGTCHLRWDGLSYYTTQRDAWLLRGTKQYLLNDGSVVTITSREQTLLDTLHRPISCGGAAVVFEAWSTALETGALDATVLLRLLKRIDYAPLSRRVGWMLDAQEFTPSRAFAAYLEQTAVEARAADPIQLLSGYAYEHIAAKWGVLTP